MIKTVFQWREDEEYGSFGWILKGFPNFNVSNGLGIAHDTLEHFPDGNGSLKDEMLAFGAMLFTRVDPGWFESRGNFKGPAYNLSSDISQFLRDVDTEYSYIPKPPRTRRIDDDHLEEVIAETMSMGIKQYLSEYEETWDCKDSIKEITRRMAGWMRIGYRRAKRRFYNNPTYELSHLFDQISKTVDAKYFSAEQGQILTIEVNPKTLSFKTRVSYEFEEEFEEQYEYE